LLTLENQILDISEIKSLAFKISKNLKMGDVLMLKGELGVGKTTFSRFIINNLHTLNKINQPSKINSPTYPILLSYNLNSYEIHHYDFYRIKNIKEIEELDFFENIYNSITLIEWPELLIDIPFKDKYYLINLNMHSEKKRVINIKYFK
tara:strand:- start:105 stop:551 length:447 start_codon:yes stop_codon:yes gene_type:complete